MAMEVSRSQPFGSIYVKHITVAQAIFYDDPSVLYVSLHAENDYPCKYTLFGNRFIFCTSTDFTGRKTETGVGAGEGYIVNYPLPRGSTDDDKYCDTLREAVQRVRQFEPAFLIVR